MKDLTPGDSDVPPFSLEGPDDYAISPDSKEVCYAMNADPVPATSTNTDLFVVSIDGGESKKITVNPGADESPQYFSRWQMAEFSAASNARDTRATAGG